VRQAQHLPDSPVYQWATASVKNSFFFDCRNGDRSLGPVNIEREYYRDLDIAAEYGLNLDFWVLAKERRRSGPARSIAHSSSLKAWLQIHFERLKQEVRVYELLLRDPRTPKLAKWILGFAVAYLLMPFDIIPDFIPVLGQLDDLIIIPALIFLALRIIPKAVVADCRIRAAQRDN
jgi:uncharacterized membrane protein YkvA (DUF1232 family)